MKMIPASGYALLKKVLKDNTYTYQIISDSWAVGTIVKLNSYVNSTSFSHNNIEYMTVPHASIAAYIVPD